MKSFTVPLPDTLHSNQGKQPNISFDLRKCYYVINDTKTKINLKDYTDKEVVYWDYSIMNKCILITLFSKNDILK